MEVEYITKYLEFYTNQLTKFMTSFSITEKSLVDVFRNIKNMDDFSLLG